MITSALYMVGGYSSSFAQVGRHLEIRLPVKGTEHPVGHRPQVGTLGLKLLRQPFVFVHRSHSLVSFRHSNDERNLTGVTDSSSGHISVRWLVRIVTRENTTGVWLKETTAEKREKDTKHAVLRHVKGRL